jgi:hypothetical protein
MNLKDKVFEGFAKYTENIEQGVKLLPVEAVHQENGSFGVTVQPLPEAIFFLSSAFSTGFPMFDCLY